MKILKRKQKGFTPTPQSQAFGVSFDQSERGFTLIELLVVISIIGLLASIVLVSLNSARQKARIVKRVTDLKQIQKALEMYYNDNSSYPNSGGIWRSVCMVGNGPVPANQVVWDTTLNKGLVPTYMSSLPIDPSTNISNNTNCYMYYGNGTNYKMLDEYITDMSVTDVQNSTLADPPKMDDVPGSICYNYQTTGYGPPYSPPSMSVYSSGAICW